MKVTLKLTAFLMIAVLFAFPAAAQDSPFKDLIQAVGCSDDYDGADIVTIFDSTHVVVEESGLSHLNVRQLTKVLTIDGAKSLSYKRFDYDPASNMIEINKVAVHKADGSVTEIDLENVLDKPQYMRMIYWGARMKLIGIPYLEPGDAVEVQYYTKGFMIAYLGDTEDDSRYIPPMRGHYYDTILFGAGHPFKEKVYVLKTLKDRPVQYKVYNGNIAVESTFDSEYFTYVFSKRDIPVYTREPNSPDASDYTPKVVLATVNDWFDKSLWFYAVNETTVVNLPDYEIAAKPFEYDDEIKDFTLELIAPYKTHQDKRKAILHWVAQHIRYSGITQGKGEGYTLHPGIMTFRDRAGVCKDIAGMALTMFRAAGYEAYPAMTMAGARVERIPADQFNHCVVAVDISGEEGTVSDNLKGRVGFENKYEMYDPTWAPNSKDIWSRAEGDQHIVIGGPKGEDLTAIRPYTADENRYTINSDVKIDNQGNLTGTLEIRGDGYMDARLRRLILGSGNKQRTKNRIANILAGIHPGVELTGYSAVNTMDHWKGMVLTIDYKISGYALLYGDGIHFESPANKFPLNATYFFTVLRIADLDEREHPLLNWAPQQLVIEENISLPRGYKLKDFEPVEKGGDFAYYNASVEQDGKGVKISTKYSVAERLVPVDVYPQVKATVDGYKDFADTEIHLWRN